MNKNTGQNLIEILHAFRAIAVSYKFELVGFFLLSLILTGAELFTVGAVIPLFASSAKFEELFVIDELSGPSIFLICFLLATLLRIAHQFCIHLISAKIIAEFSAELVRQELRQAKFPGSIGDSVNSVKKRADALVGDCVFPALSALSSILVLIGLSIIVSKLISFGALLVILAVVIGFSSVVLLGRRFLRQISVDLDSSSTKSFERLIAIMNDALFLRLSGDINCARDIFERHEYIHRAAQAYKAIIINAPKFVIEFIGAVSLVYLFSLTAGESPSLSLAEVVAVGVALQRSTPYVQQIFQAVVTFKGNERAIYKAAKIFNGELGKSSKEFRFKLLDLEGNLKSFRDVLATLHDRPYQILVLKAASGVGKTTFLNQVVEELSSSYSVSYCPQVYDAWAETLPQFVGSSKTEEKLLPIFENYLQEFNLIGLIKTFRTDSKIPFADRLSSMSFGQRKRLFLIRSLIRMQGLESPKILVLDEPTAGLDSDNASIVLNHLLKLCRSIPIIISTHDQAFTTQNSALMELKRD